MPERRIDLHAHTTHSDGTLAPAALVALAAEVGLHALAITDHDTTSALPEARAAAADLGVEIWTGCEVTCGMPSGIAHVLAYAFDEQDAGLQALLMRVRAGREERNTGIYERLEALGVPVTVAEVEQHADSPIVARPHFARALVAAGHVETVRQAFDRYLRDGGPAYVRPLVPPAPEAVAAVVAAGGVAVLAHPRSLKLGSRTAYRAAFATLCEAGLVGLEVDHPSQDPSLRAQFAELALELGLERSGGSDFHGHHKPGIALGSGDGTIDVRYATWSRLMARAGRAA